MVEWGYNALFLGLAETHYIRDGVALLQRRPQGNAVAHMVREMHCGYESWHLLGNNGDLQTIHYFAAYSCTDCLNRKWHKEKYVRIHFLWFAKIITIKSCFSQITFPDTKSNFSVCASFISPSETALKDKHSFLFSGSQFKTLAWTTCRKQLKESPKC